MIPQCHIPGLPRLQLRVQLLDLLVEGADRVVLLHGDLFKLLQAAQLRTARRDHVARLVRRELELLLQLGQVGVARQVELVEHVVQLQLVLFVDLCNRDGNS